MDEKWELESNDIAYYDNTGNGHFAEWVGLRENGLVGLFGKYLDVHSPDIKVKVKARKGKIVIEQR